MVDSVTERTTPKLLLDTLRHAQRVGMLGDRPIEEVVDHARWFVAAIEDLPGAESDPVTDRGGGALRIVDLGSGGGVPGLVLAVDRPDAEIWLVDRRAKRTDFLELAVAKLRRAGLLGAEVHVRSADVAALAREIGDGRLAAFDVATARGFGPPAVTLRFATALVRPGGRIVVSEPPSGDRWDPRLIEELGLRRGPVGRVAVFERMD
jgi:16S rRNA (guanine527-N7)-methyltransferase